MKKFDVFVIGTGVSGTAIANRFAGEGLSVGIADNRPFGGTCSTRGCVPKKVLWGVIDVAENAKRLKGNGIAHVPEVNWPDLMAFKNSFTDPVPEAKEKSFSENGIETFLGTATFVSQNRLQIDGKTVEAKKIVIATGATPRKLSIEGAEHLRTSDDFLELKKLPEHLLFIGGGYIAFEFAHMAALCGSKVTIINKDDSLLKNFDGDLVQHVVEQSKKMGINFVLNANVEEVIKSGNDFKVITRKTDSQVEFIADIVINSSGRVPAISDLDLEKGNITFSENGVEVNEHLQSVSNANVFATGDVSATAALPLTPLASMEANIVASQITGADAPEADYSVMPTVVFTHPPMASVGITEIEAIDKSLQFDVNYHSAMDWLSAKRQKVPVYAYKTITDKITKKVLGAHLVGPHAEETINLFAMAKKAGLKTNEIKEILYVFPSSAADISSML